jgi:4-carboxymuconolactone decarboxylase
MSRLKSWTLLGAVLVACGIAASAQAPDADPRVRLREGVKREDLDADGRRTYDLIVNPTNPHSTGLPAPIGMWMHSPPMAKHVLPAYMHLRFGNVLGVRLTTIGVLVAGRELNSGTQWGTHSVNAQRIGLEPEVVTAIGTWGPLERLAEKDAVAIQLGRELFGDRRVTSQTFASALRLFGRRGLTELAGLMAFYRFLYLSSNVTFELPSSGNWPPLPAAQRPAARATADRAGDPSTIDPESRARLPRVRREDLDEEGRETYDLIVNQTTPYGLGLPTPIGMWMHSPAMAQHILPAYMYLRFGNSFGVRLTELAILVAAREINSQYQWTSHEPTALKAGVQRELVDVVKYRRGLEGLGEKDALIVRFGRELLRDEKVTAATFSHAMRVFGTAGVTDLAALLAFYEFLMLSSNATFDLQMPADAAPLLPPV